GLGLAKPVHPVERAGLGAGDLAGLEKQAPEETFQWLAGSTGNIGQDLDMVLQHGSSSRFLVLSLTAPEKVGSSRRIGPRRVQMGKTDQMGLISKAVFLQSGVSGALCAAPGGREGSWRVTRASIVLGGA